MILLISISFPIPFCSYTFPFLSFLYPFFILLHIFLSPLFFLYAFPSYFLTFPTHCLAVPKLILLFLVISYYPFNCKHCIMPSYCAVLYLAIINFIGSSFKSLCNSALLCHCRSFINLSFVVTFLV